MPLDSGLRRCEYNSHLKQFTSHVVIRFQAESVTDKARLTQKKCNTTRSNDGDIPSASTKVQAWHHEDSDMFQYIRYR